jgi:hypothetical protein
MPERKEKASFSSYTNPSASLMLIFLIMPMGYSAARTGIMVPAAKHTRSCRRSVRVFSSAS